jgi:hypothetical protein
VEGVRCVAAVLRRVRESVDGVEELDERTGPTMGQNERQRVLVPGTDVQKVNAQTVQPRPELRIAVDPPFEPVPVVVVPPVLEQRADLLDRRPLLPGSPRLVVGQPCAAESFTQVVHRARGYGHLEGNDLVNCLCQLESRLSRPGLCLGGARPHRSEHGCGGQRGQGAAPGQASAHDFLPLRADRSRLEGVLLERKVLWPGDLRRSVTVFMSSWTPSSRTLRPWAGARCVRCRSPR